ncbi:MAG: phosphoglucosamine mutase [Bacteroidia bacterium]|nr:MAG: phosphoglucosamine mutase [Bacteroidia bacterium]
MVLIQSISGIRGTIGGRPGEGLSPVDVMTFAGAYGMWLKNRNPDTQLKVVIGRDARLSGPVITHIVTATLQAMGIDVIDLGLSTTPTVELGVKHHTSHGGIVITASHNPKNWNALKLLNEKGEFMTKEEGEAMQVFAEPLAFSFVPSDMLGRYITDEKMLERHIDMIRNLPLVDTEAIAAANFHIVVDGINSSGGVAVPALLRALGVQKITGLHCEPTGLFQHNPEPLPEHLHSLSAEVESTSAHLGIAVDPDVDRLAMVCENGDMFGEEYTLVAVADYVLSKTPGNTVSNLSSSQALAEVTKKHGGLHFYSPVGEAHVVEAMKKHHAVIGGEGNGGVIYPALHYGRDALAGIALFLSALALRGISASRLKNTLPQFHISKNKIELPEGVDIGSIIGELARKYREQPQETIDGLKIWFDNQWVHLRASNTEPIIRMYTESDSMVKAEKLAKLIQSDISGVIRTMR